MVSPSSQSSISSSPYYAAFTFPFLSCLAIIYSVTSNLYVRLMLPQRSGGGGGASIRHAISSSTTSTPAAGRQHAKVAIVTGSNTGIGYETARALVCDHGYTVILACRSMDKARTAADRIHNSMPKAVAGSAAGQGQAVVVVPLDLSSFASIKAFTDAVKSQYTSIHVLVNNAGRNTSGPSSPDCSGTLDLMFQSNFLGHFALTSQLIGIMTTDKDDSEARIVNLSSVMHHYCRVSEDLNDSQFWCDVATGKHCHTSGYSLSKLAAVLFTLELNKRYANNKIRSIAVNPGCVYVNRRKILASLAMMGSLSSL